MPAVNPGDVWMVDFGLAAKVRPALLFTGNPAVEELDLITVLLHTTSLRDNRRELSIPKPFLKPGAFHLQQIQSVSTVKLERRLGAFALKSSSHQILDCAGRAQRRRRFRTAWRIRKLQHPPQSGVAFRLPRSPRRCRDY